MSIVVGISVLVPRHFDPLIPGVCRNCNQDSSIGLERCQISASIPHVAGTYLIGIPLAAHMAALVVKYDAYFTHL